MAQICQGGKGESLQLKVKEELEYGVEEYSGFYEIARNEFELDKGVDEITSPTIEQGRAQPRLILGDQDVAGSMEVPLDTDASYLFLKTLFGSNYNCSGWSKLETRICYD